MDAPLYTAPDFATSALITIDVQCDFLDGGSSTIPGTSAVVPQMARLAEAFRVAGRPVIHMVRIYQPDGSNADLVRRAALESGAAIVLPDTEGMALASELSSSKLDSALLLSGQLQPLGSAEWAIYKPRWGAFYQTLLEEFLRGRGITTLVFAGCNFPNCPRTSIYEASERDFRVVLAEDAISGIYELGKKELVGIGVHLMLGEEIGRRLRELKA
jgi:nicotinamidase-related amidase